MKAGFRKVIARSLSDAAEGRILLAILGLLSMV
jgi:hypothetical protein